MSLHPVLQAFQERLNRLGIVTVSYAEYLEVRLPLFCCIRVRFDGERLTCDAYFGALARTPATVASTSAVAIVTAGLFLTVGATPIAFAAAFIGLASRVHEACRYVVTEAYITRIQLLWAAVADAPAATVLSGARGTVIAGGSPDELGRVSARGERVRVE
jgi:hypothetical protein